jgi:hypothetical protein
MLKAVQQTIRVGTGGKIELIAPECPEGTDVQVIVLLPPEAKPEEAPTVHLLQGDGASGKRQRAIAQIQAVVRRYVPEGRSLVDELIGDRRIEAEGE